MKLTKALCMYVTVVWLGLLLGRPQWEQDLSLTLLLTSETLILTLGCHARALS